MAPLTAVLAPLMAAGILRKRWGKLEFGSLCAPISSLH
jgi:hypothetical protein